jgi:hypothetical protein
MATIGTPCANDSRVVFSPACVIPRSARFSNAICGGRHTHGLLTGGLTALESVFPGLFEEARKAGGLGVDLTRDAYCALEEENIGDSQAISKVYSSADLC